MTEIVFLNVRNDENELYHSYRDEYYKLVELSEFKTIELNEIEYDRDYYIVVSPRNGNVYANFTHEQAKDHKCKFVLYLLEWPTYENGFLKDAELEPYWDIVLVADRHLQKVLQEYNPNHDIRFCFFGGHEVFGGKPKHEKWDFVTLAYAYATRAHKIEILATNGYSFAPSQSDCWGNAKEEALAHARWGLCLHQFNVPFLNSQRLTLFASWQLPIISDYCVDPYPYKFFPEGLIHFDPRNTICGDRQIMKDAADYNYALVQRHTFRQCVEDAVKGIETRIGL